MKITSITEDDWNGSVNQSTQFECKTIEHFEHAIDRLNGINKTLHVAKTRFDLVMTIGGGNDGRFVVQIIKGPDEQFHTLCRQNGQCGDLVEVVSGGQSGMYPIRYCVDKEQVLSAARFFAERISACPELIWDIDG